MTTLGGVLQFATVDLGGGSYVPQLGDQFTFLTSDGGIEGEFDSTRFPAIGEGLRWKVVTGEMTSYLAVVSAALAGDYNDDGAVDAADYTTWRNALDNNTPLSNETETPGVADAADYDAWKANFGAGSAGIGVVVPEPASASLIRTRPSILSRRLPVVIAVIKPIENRIGFIDFRVSPTEIERHIAAAKKVCSLAQAVR